MMRGCKYSMHVCLEIWLKNSDSHKTCRRAPKCCRKFINLKMQVMPGNLVDSIKIRMYNTVSVGDCFLFLFQKNGVNSFSMMIDCGGIKTTSALVTPVAQDILNTTGGKIDLLLGTHQHEDHLSGFNLARPVFDQIKVGEVWMSWVEDETDPIAKIVKQKYGKKLKQLQATM